MGLRRTPLLLESDSRFRSAQRRYRATGAPEDKESYQRHATRAGKSDEYAHDAAQETYKKALADYNAAHAAHVEAGRQYHAAYQREAHPPTAVDRKFVHAMRKHRKAHGALLQAAHEAGRHAGADIKQHEGERNDRFADRIATLTHGYEQSGFSHPNRLPGLGAHYFRTPEGAKAHAAALRKHFPNHKEPTIHDIDPATEQRHGTWARRSEGHPRLFAVRHHHPVQLI